MEDYIFDKEELTEDDLGTLLMDSENNQAFVTRDVVSSELVDTGIQRGYQTYGLENVEYGPPYIKPITDNFNEEDELMILGKLRGRA